MEAAGNLVGSGVSVRRGTASLRKELRCALLTPGGLFLCLVGPFIAKICVLSTVLAIEGKTGQKS